MTHTAYQTLADRFARLARLSDALGILSWDTHTMMPDGAAAARGETVATLKVIEHELLTDPAVADLLDEAALATDLDAWQAGNLREMRRIRLHAGAVPADLVAANARAIAACEMVWRTARAEADFAALLPSLSEVLRLQREVGAAKAAALGLPLYDALLDAYEPGGRADAIDVWFDDLADFLPAFTAAVLDRQASRPAPIDPSGPFPMAAQQSLARSLMAAVGYDFQRGRLDVSLHPFCGGASDDVRITTRYNEHDFLRSLMAVLHETGHAMYEQGRPQAWRDQPVGDSRGMVLHESQSLLVEMQVCRDRAFLEAAAPLISGAFGTDGPAWHADNLYRLCTRVERSLIRVDADEVTYPAHVILRYRLERSMLSGDLALADLPGAWNDGMRDLVGVAPPDDRSGCLQDIHWPDGAWAYFPTYTLGAMAAAQLFRAAREQDPEVGPALARADFAPLMAWLRRNVHGVGSLYDTDDVLVRATGARLGTAAFKDHLRARYLNG